MKKILIIDDDPDIVEAMKMVLEAQDFEVHSALNGTEGLSKVKQVHPDLIILDVMMDQLTEGFQVSYTLKNAAPGSEYGPFVKTPILMVTAVGKEMHMKFSPETDGAYLPVDAFLEKPVQPKMLIEKVKTLLAMA
jgi:DNA-binding response OmpR family regulator